jgi:hypothetical protein
MKSFIRIIIGILASCLSIRFFSNALTAPNSFAGEIYFLIATISLIASLFCFIGDIFE